MNKQDYVVINGEKQWKITAMKVKTGEYERKSTKRKTQTGGTTPLHAYDRKSTKRKKRVIGAARVYSPNVGEKKTKSVKRKQAEQPKDLVKQEASGSEYAGERNQPEST